MIAASDTFQFAALEQDDWEHEDIHVYQDAATGLRAVIAIHSTALGPAIGGCRMLPYKCFADALDDVLRLSRGMTYKCAIGEIPFGGGKAVIIGSPDKDKTPQLLGAFAKRVDGLGGRYITSFDAGTTLDDVRTMSETTRHVGGIDPVAGNASESTADTVFACLVRAFEIQFGSRSAKSRHVAIQGAGNVGLRLARRVLASGGRVTICDVSEKSLVCARSIGCEIVPPEEILEVTADAFAPCALGGTLTAKTVNSLKAPIICGGANNQMSAADAATAMTRRDILYCPDFLANAGGIIDLHYQLNRPPRTELPSHLERIADKLFTIVSIARSEQVPTHDIAERLAEETISRARLNAA